MNILKKIMGIPDDEIRDDDHLERKEAVTEKEAKEAVKEMADKYGEGKEVNSSKFADLFLKGLKKVKMFFFY